MVSIIQWKRNFNEFEICLNLVQFEMFWNSDVNSSNVIWHCKECRSNDVNQVKSSTDLISPIIPNTYNLQLMDFKLKFRTRKSKVKWYMHKYQLINLKSRVYWNFLNPMELVQLMVNSTLMKCWIIRRGKKSLYLLSL